MRHAEFVRLAEEGRAERPAMRPAAPARDDRAEGHRPDPRDGRRVRDSTGEEWMTLARESEALARALRSVERVGRDGNRGDEP